MTKNTQTAAPINIDLFQCALINNQGKEIPITRSMIRQACEAFESTQDNHYAQIPKPSARI